MGIEIGEFPHQMQSDLFKRLHGISFPTVGHYLEDGFCDAGIVRQCGEGRIVGTAVTVRITAQDSTMLHHAVSQLRERDVLMVDTGGDRRHAPVGLVVATAASCRGASGVVVDGVITDIDEILPLGLPVYSRGRSVLTTKLLGQSEGGLNVPVVCGGVVVRPGDIVLADSNGVAVFKPEALTSILGEIEADDASEPELLENLKRGAVLGQETGASEIIRRLVSE